MDLFSGMKEEVRKKVVSSWSRMNEGGKSHFINQVSLALSIWGSDDAGKKMVCGILENMVNDGSQDLSDFGLYLDTSLASNEGVERAGMVKRAMSIIDGYRLKNALASEPRKDIGI